MRTLPARLEAAAERGGAVTFIVDGAPERVEWGRLFEDAAAAAATLQARGVGPGEHVALVGPTTRELVTGIEAVWLTGATMVVLPLPMRLGSVEEFVAQTVRRIRAADVGLVVADPELAPFLEDQATGAELLLLSELVAGEDRREASAFERRNVDPDELAILQFTSGSTADPKGVMLPHHTLCANLDAIAEAAALDVSTDVMVSWLPLYHDMGLVGCLALPATTGTDLVLAAPQDFMARPASWMELISTYGGTATAGPNFSWVLATRALATGPRLDLSSLRLALSGAEPVDPDAVDRFVEEAGRHGLRAEAVFPAFGMAEVGIGGTFPEPMSGMRTDLVDRRSLESDRYAAPAEPDAPETRRLAFLGRPLPGLEIRIVDPETGLVVGDRNVGELQIRGTSVTPGYYRNERATRALLRDGWLCTGDLAYVVDGEMVMCGRIKDVIIIGGRSVFPEDIERTVAGIEGVRAGNVCAFGVEGTKGRETVVVVAETRADDLDLVRKHIHHRVLEVTGVPAKHVFLAAPSTLPKTSSGKLQRSLCRKRFLVGELEPA